MKKETILVRGGLAHGEPGGVINVPVCRASTIKFDNVAELNSVLDGKSTKPSYGRSATPSHKALQEALAELEGADHALVFASGLAAIICSLLANLQQGDHLLMVDSAYGSARDFIEHEFPRMGIAWDYYDPAIGADIVSLIKPNTKVIYLESPGSLTFEMQDIAAITAVAKQHAITTIADNTWATPLYFDPFLHGIDISMHSATKYINGHADVVMGVLTCKEPYYKALHKTYKLYGLTASADNCYLALRGLRSMQARIEKQQISALKIAQWLSERKEVNTVLYPPLESSPGHELWKHYMTGGASLFTMLLDVSDYTTMAKFVDHLKLFNIGFSWGGFESLVLPFNVDNFRTVRPWPYKGYPIRLHIGLEHADDLIEDLDGAFNALVN